MRFVLLAAVALGLAMAGAVAAPASEWVEFTSATTPPTPFALKQAKARGVELKQEPGIPLRGLLIRPDGAGPFPAVVLLHGCDGVRPFQERWAEDLAGWGYVALLVDSHGPRGIGDDCARWSPDTDDRAFDAFGALRFLRGLTHVDPARIGVLGWDTGGRRVMGVLDLKGVQQFVPERFAAGVAIYPVGLPRPPVIAPELILVGDEDDCQPAAGIQRAAREDGPGPVQIEVEILPGAGHGFDDPRFVEPVRFTAEQVQNCFYTGTTMTYSGAARDLAAERVRAFLEEHLR
jgi:dienelactone hydrolase